MSRWKGLYYSLTDNPSAEQQAQNAFAQAREAVAGRVRYVDPYESAEREVEDLPRSAGTPRPSSRSASKANPEDETKTAALIVRRVYDHVVRDNWDMRTAPQTGTPRTDAGWEIPLDRYTERWFGDSDDESDSDKSSRRKRKAEKAVEVLAAEAEEMQFNAGLRLYKRRRDTWTNAQNNPAVFGDHKPPAPSDEKRFIPVVQPIMMDNSARALSANPEFRTSLYNKHIIQGRALAVPVPLSQMVNALVQGWKRDGEWPPTPKDLRPAVARRRV